LIFIRNLRRELQPRHNYSRNAWSCTLRKLRTEILAAVGDRLLYKQGGGEAIGLYEGRLSPTGKLSDRQERVADSPFAVHWAFVLE